MHLNLSRYLSTLLPRKQCSSSITSRARRTRRGRFVWQMGSREQQLPGVGSSQAAELKSSGLRAAMLHFALPRAAPLVRAPPGHIPPAQGSARNCPGRNREHCPCLLLLLLPAAVSAQQPPPDAGLLPGCVEGTSEGGDFCAEAAPAQSSREPPGAAQAVHSVSVLMSPAKCLQEAVCPAHCS